MQLNQEQLARHLSAVVKPYNVEVLFAVIAGSRAWGLSRQDSDYDVRFVYKSSLDRYVGLDKPSESITFAKTRVGVCTAGHYHPRSVVVRPDRHV